MRPSLAVPAFVPAIPRGTFRCQTPTATNPLQSSFPMVATIHHIIDRAGIFNPQLPGHKTDLITHPARVKTRIDPCYGEI
jgi:hypothetical protein